MSLILNDVAKFITSKVEITNIDESNYVSTENMLPNKGGVDLATSLPDTKSVRSYMPNDILINNIRPYFKKIWFANKEGGCSNDVFVLRANENYDSKFLYYVLSSDDFFSYVMANAKGTKMPRGDKKAIQNYSVPDFSIENQMKISQFLSKIDEKIEINKKINHNLEQQIEVLFKSYFVKFDLIDCDNFKETIFGEIPDDWEIIELNTILKERNEKSLDQSIQMYSITIDGVRSREETYKKKITAKTTQFKITYKDDIIFGMPNSGYQFGIMEDDIGGVSSAYPVFSINKIPARYVKYFINNTSNYFNDIVKSGSRMGQGIDKKVLLSKEIYIPPKNILEEYYSLEKQYLDIIECNSKEIEKLENLRNTLLPKLMSGEIDVSDINCDLD